jgi:cellulose synthase/poly-beta-1,6-N-acetylglucosamine synthase-like glycosyltransferase
MFTVIFNYIAWFIFVFIGVVWILVMIKNRSSMHIDYKLPKKLPMVSVLIPAYNEGETIAKTIKSVINIDYPKHLLETIVINDSSTDDTGKVAKEFENRGEIRLLTNKKNKGKAYSLNRAIGLCKGEYVACVDADSMVEPGILKKMIGYFKDPSIAAVTPALKIWKINSFLEKAQHAEYLLNVFLRKMLAFLDSVHVTPGVFSLYSKSVLQEIGGFEEDNLTEDMEIALKIHKHGYRIENNLSAMSYTMCPSKWRDLFNQRLRWYRGAIQNTIKYRHMLFNRKYGNLGFFFFPANFMAVFIIIGVFFLLAWNYTNLVLSTIWRMSLINWDFTLFFGELNVAEFLAQIINTPLMLSAVGIVIGGYVLYTSFSLSGENVRKNKPGYFLYLIIFPFVYMVFWAMALIYEALGLKRNW